MDAVETVARAIVGEYRGKHISGASDRVFDALATIEYRYPSATLRVSGVPVQWDEEHQRQYMHASDGLRLHAIVRAFTHAHERHTDRTIPLRVNVQMSQPPAEAA